MILEILSSVLQASSPKDITECPDVKMSTSQKNGIEQEVLSVYDEYIKFMGIGKENTVVHQLPLFQLYLKQCRDDMGIGTVEYKNGIYNLYISDIVFRNGIKKDILFHEFTHIYDKEFLYNRWFFKKDSKHDFTHIYSEIHAEQVKFLYVLGCTNINETVLDLTYRTKVLSLGGEEKEFYTCLSDLRKDIINYSNQFENIQNINKRLNDKPFESLLNKIAYYIGEVSIYQKFCNYKIDELLDLTKVSIFWEKDMKVFETQTVKNLKELLSLCCNTELEQLNKTEISDIGTLLMHNWYANAKDNLHIR